MGYSEPTIVAVLSKAFLPKAAEQNLKAAGFTLWDRPVLFNPFEEWGFIYWWPLVRGRMVCFPDLSLDHGEFWRSLIRLGLLSSAEIRKVRSPVYVVCAASHGNKALVKLAGRLGFTVVDGNREDPQIDLNERQETVREGLEISLEDQYKACAHPFAHGMKNSSSRRGWDNNSKFLRCLLSSMCRDFSSMNDVDPIKKLCMDTIDFMNGSRESFDTLIDRWKKLEVQCINSQKKVDKWWEKEIGNE